MRVHMTWIAALTLLLVSITPKVFGALNADHEATEKVIPAYLMLALSQSGYKKIAIRHLANDGIHVASLYTSETCQGIVAVVPLSRNAEGIHLLSAVFGDTKTQLQFLFQDNIYEQFPELLFAWSRFSTSALRYVGAIQPAPVAWALSATKDCAIAL
jgi:hypothetical protein